ncbi:MAG: hypothetical protein GY701_27365 [Sulfitobacter sp.]|nr:hypothetical protein [Sulfitobacter sp.]MCP4102482.1 hypothetical protein [Lentisphaerota bacterium]
MNFGPIGDSPNPLQRWLADHPRTYVVVSSFLASVALALILVVMAAASGPWESWIPVVAAAVAIGMTVLVSLLWWFTPGGEVNPEMVAPYWPWIRQDHDRSNSPRPEKRLWIRGNRGRWILLAGAVLLGVSGVVQILRSVIDRSYGALILATLYSMVAYDLFRRSKDPRRWE